MSTRALSRIAAVLYLLVAVGGGFAESVRSGLTAANLAGNATLYRAAFVADLFDFACFLGVGLLLYAIFKSVNPTVALAMLVINAVSVAIQALNMVNHVGAQLTTDPKLVQLFLDLHRQGYLIAQVYFGGYLLPLGYLVYKSGFFPKVLGTILMVGSAGYVAGVVVTYLSPNFQSSLAVYPALVGGLAELIFLIWLLISPTTRTRVAMEAA
ncbi:MAG TPA: DUF4386 domain-containing protein [Candidatus Dormibacteraeota bacterium]|nr:DUF4386 domain-containing protein [Candidatus Dormibacteraeota bacterium]